MQYLAKASWRQMGTRQRISIGFDAQKLIFARSKSEKPMKRSYVMRLSFVRLSELYGYVRHEEVRFF